jgi:hypothetical protein
VDQEKSKPSLLTASEGLSAREGGQLPGIPGQIAMTREGRQRERPGMLGLWRFKA